MQTLLIALFLSQAPAPAPGAPDPFGRGLLMQVAGWCITGQPSPLTLKFVSAEPTGAGAYEPRWVARPVSGCAPRGNPFSFIARALDSARTEDGPVGSMAPTPPPGDWGRSAFAAATKQPFPERKPPRWTAKYTPQLIQATFDAFYRKPGQTIDGLSAQLVYDVGMKQAVHEQVDAWLVFLKATTPAQRKSLARAYVAAAEKEDFDFYKYLKALHERVTKAPSAEGAQVAGVVLRRTQDGTLPTVLKLLVKVLDDYDPGYAKSVRGPLLAAAR